MVLKNRLFNIKLSKEMKKYYSIVMVLAMMVVTLSFTACAISEDELVGEWIVKSDIEGSKPTHMLLKSDGTYVETKSGDEVEGEWALSGSVLSLKNSFATFEYEIVEKDNGKMTVKMKGMDLTLYFEKVKDQ